MIRTATPDDLDAIMALERAAFPSDAWSEAAMAGELASPHGRYLVDDEGGRVVGYAGLRAPADGHDGDVQPLAVAAASRGRGRGRALLRELLAEASTRRIREVFLEVRADNPSAQALYASEGFAEIGRRPRYYQPDDVDAVVMRLDVAGWLAAHGPHTAGVTAQKDASVAEFGADAATQATSCDQTATGGRCS